MGNKYLNRNYQIFLEKTSISMADFTEVVLSGTTYQVPKNMSTPPWGEELADYLVALGSAYSALIGVGDITETGFIVANNQTVSAPVTGLTFDSSVVRSATISYSIYRTTSTTALREAGEVTVIYDSTATAGSKWVLQRDSMGDALVELTVSDTGIFSYTSSNVSGASYSGLMKFEAKATLQT